MNDTKIKICGIKTTEEAAYLNEANVDYAGCVFHKASKRYVTFDQAEKIIDALSENIKKVAVTVSPDPDLVKEIEKIGFDILQVHNELSKEVVESSHIPIWYACNISNEDKMTEALRFTDGLNEEDLNKITGIVMDAPDFGSGKTFDWNVNDIPAFRKSRRLLKAGAQSPPVMLILAGGLNSENVAEGIRVFEPDIVDVSSGVEGESGKDREKINKFVKAVRSI